MIRSATLTRIDFFTKSLKLFFTVLIGILVAAIAFFLGGAMEPLSNTLSSRRGNIHNNLACVICIAEEAGSKSLPPARPHSYPFCLPSALRSLFGWTVRTLLHFANICVARGSCREYDVTHDRCQAGYLGSPVGKCKTLS